MIDFTTPQESITFDTGSGGACGMLVLSTEVNNLYEGEETVTISLVVTSGDATLDQSVFIVTILDPPEFISDTDQYESNNNVVNDDFFDTVYFDSDYYSTGSVVYTPDLHIAREVTFSSDNASGGSGGGSADFTIDSATGEIIYGGSMCGKAIIAMEAEYVGLSGFSDQLNGSLRWASMSKAITDVGSLWVDRYNSGTWWLGTNTCERFANYFYDGLGTLKSSNYNAQCAIKTMNIVTFSLTGQWPATKHAAVEIHYINGTVLYYDNNAFGGIFTLSDIPSWATPDF